MNYYLCLSVFICVQYEIFGCGFAALCSSVSNSIFCGAVNYVAFRAATNPTWFVAEREGFEPSVPLLAEHTISSRAPSASSVISPQLQKFKLVGHR